jgi:hypothetical protein
MWKYTKKYGKYTFYRFDQAEFVTKNVAVAESFIAEFNVRRIGT